MRIVFDIKLLCKNDKILIPTTYRKNFVALLKESFKNHPELNSLYQDTKQKPFTFSVHFDIKESKNGYLELANNQFELYFSTNDFLILTTFYNFMLKKLNNYKIFSDKENLIVDIRMLNNKDINTNSMIFKTLSPIVIRDMKNKDGDKTLRHDEDGFLENLKLSVKSSIKSFIGDEIEPKDLDIEILDMKSNLITSHGNGHKKYAIFGNSGLIKIDTKPQYLQLLYDIGIGAKRSQGFGMVEVKSIN